MTSACHPGARAAGRTVPTRADFLREHYRQNFHREKPNRELTRRLAHFAYSNTTWSTKVSFWIIGSSLDEKRRADDLDLLLIGLPHAHLTVSFIEEALYGLAEFGRSVLRVSIDPVFRHIHLEYRDVPDKGGRQLTIWKLDNPATAHAYKNRTPGSLRRAGRLLMISRRPFDNMSYYYKLPIGSFGRPQLRPAVELRMFL